MREKIGKRQWESEWEENGKEDYLEKLLNLVKGKLEGGENEVILECIRVISQLI